MEFPLYNVLLDPPAPNPELRRVALRYRSPLYVRQSMAANFADPMLYSDIT